MKKLNSYVLVFLGLFLFSGIDAQVTDGVKQWSLNDCFQYAGEHNIQINTLRLNQQLAQQDVYVSKGAMLPGLSASLTNTFNSTNSGTGVNGASLHQITSSGSYTLNSSLNLWNGHYLQNNIRQKAFLEQSAGLSVEAVSNSITLYITQVYLDILLAKENKRYIADLVNTSTERVKQGGQFFDAGSIAKKDLLQLKAQLASDQYLLVQAQNSIKEKMLLLKQSLQLPSNFSFDIQSWAGTDSLEPLPQLDAAQQYALGHFPEIKISRINMDVARLEMAKAKAGFKPLLSANAALASGYSDVITNAASGNTRYFRQVGDGFYQRLGFSLAIPVFSNRINRANLGKASIQFKQSALNFTNSELVLSQLVEQAYLNASNAQQAFYAAREQWVATQESYRIVNEQFKLGAINVFDLYQQRTQYVQAVQAFVQTKYTALLQQKIYTFYLGKSIIL